LQSTEPEDPDIIIRDDIQNSCLPHFGLKILRKMGWDGKGLGKNENGILAPISIQSNKGNRGLGSTGKNRGFGSTDKNRGLGSTDKFSRFCEVCNVTVMDAIWDVHAGGRKHKKKLEKHHPSLEYCIYCKLNVDKNCWDSHIGGKKHQKNMKNFNENPFGDDITNEKSQPIFNSISTPMNYQHSNSYSPLGVFMNPAMPSTVYERVLKEAQPSIEKLLFQADSEDESDEFTEFDLHQAIYIDEDQIGTLWKRSEVLSTK